MKKGNFEKDRITKTKVFETEPLVYGEVMSRIAHEPGTDAEELNAVRNRLSKLKIGESFDYPTLYDSTEGVATDGFLTITRIDEKRYSLKEPQD